jgi:hypothetical protein
MCHLQLTQLSHEDRTVGLICAYPKEMAAAIGMLDERHKEPRASLRNGNSYALSSIDEHNAVIASLPAGGCEHTSAANVARDMQHTFLSICFGLMVGIEGGAPSFTPGSMLCNDHRQVVQSKKVD